MGKEEIPFLFGSDDSATGMASRECKEREEEGRESSAAGGGREVLKGPGS